MAESHTAIAATTVLEQRLQRTLPMATLEVVAPPGCDGIRLALVSRDFPTGPLPQEVMNAVIAAPAYWAFCWGSGIGLVRFLVEHRGLVQNKTVLDLGAGSGVVAIAAAKLGAARVVACDNDRNARLAIRTNAAINGVADVMVTPSLDACEADNDVVLMADVLYDAGNVELLFQAQRHARSVLVADSRITELPMDGYDRLTSINALTYPNLGGFDEFGTAHVFHWQDSWD